MAIRTFEQCFCLFALTDVKSRKIYPIFSLCYHFNNRNEFLPVDTRDRRDCDRAVLLETEIIGSVLFYRVMSRGQGWCRLRIVKLLNGSVF